MSQLTDPEAAHKTLRLIDTRQDQILEDLDRLNDQIEAIILMNTAQREEEQAGEQTHASGEASTSEMPEQVRLEDAA